VRSAARRTFEPETHGLGRAATALTAAPSSHFSDCCFAPRTAPRILLVTVLGRASLLVFRVWRRCAADLAGRGGVVSRGCIVAPLAMIAGWESCRGGGIKQLACWPTEVTGGCGWSSRGDSSRSPATGRNAGHCEAELCRCGLCQAPVRRDQRASQASGEGGVERVVAGHRSAEPAGRDEQLPAGNPFDRSVIEQRQRFRESQGLRRPRPPEPPLPGRAVIFIETAGGPGRMVRQGTSSVAASADRAQCPRCWPWVRRGIMGGLVPRRPPGLAGLFREQRQHLCLIFGLSWSWTTRTCT
jgi:hypothetical protein